MPITSSKSPISTTLVFKSEKSPLDSGFCYKARLGGYSFEIYRKAKKLLEDSACFIMFGRTRKYKNLDSGLMASEEFLTPQDGIDFLHQKATEIGFDNYWEEVKDIQAENTPPQLSVEELKQKAKVLRVQAPVLFYEKHELVEKEVFDHEFDNDIYNNLEDVDLNPNMSCLTPIIVKKPEPHDTTLQFLMMLDIDIKTGRVANWQEDIDNSLNIKVCDDGIYSILDDTDTAIHIMKHKYVPELLEPYDANGDYINITITKDGYIKEWDESKLTEIYNHQPTI